MVLITNEANGDGLAHTANHSARAFVYGWPRQHFCQGDLLMFLFPLALKDGDVLQ